MKYSLLHLIKENTLATQYTIRNVQEVALLLYSNFVQQPQDRNPGFDFGKKLPHKV